MHRLVERVIDFHPCPDGFIEGVIRCHVLTLLGLNEEWVVRGDVNLLGKAKAMRLRQSQPFSDVTQLFLVNRLAWLLALAFMGPPLFQVVR